MSPVTVAPAPQPIAPPLPTDSSDSSLDDADALPAVGKVWDDGPKRSLGEILAQANRRKEAANTPQVQPAARPSGPSHLPGDLASIWPAVLQQVHDELGVAVHVPLSSGTPVRNDDRVTIRFGAVFAAMSRYLAKYHQQIQQILCTVAGEALLLHFEVSESAPPPAAPVRSVTGPAAPGQSATHSAPPSAPPAPSREGVTLTPELRAQLEKDPLIRAVMEQFNGNIVKVEE